MCLRYAELERKLGEIDRARSIYMHAAQFCDPQTNSTFWDTWKEFEIQHGNQGTFSEFLRIRRSVQAQYNTSVNFNMNADILKQIQEEERSKQRDEIRKLEEQAKEEETARADNSMKPEEMNTAQRFAPDLPAPRVANTEEIDIDVEATEEEDVDKDFEIEKKTIPSAVFGSAVVEEFVEDKDRKPAMGATERLKKKRKMSQM
eukprot:TRINITY_DN2857_c0_g1_i1.p1 TRINITY_DN2857_c0_g1~~TRINITY_DN2857_c0_g1_i1.p1  ORF type:complete len:203 (-),score=53.31 TRINITY_DN2857_c0_g1_i1:144-752(-)